MTNIVALAIPELLLISPVRHGDERGFFSETYRKDVLSEAGFHRPFVQDNQSRTQTKGTVRGLHFQSPPNAQDKLIRVTRGAILDVAVDIRQGSPTYGRSCWVELSAENWRQLLVPRGFAHGFMTLTDDCEVLYKVSDLYVPSMEGGLLWSDPDLRIAWPSLAENAITNARDAAWPTLRDFQSPFKMDAED